MGLPHKRQHTEYGFHIIYYTTHKLYHARNPASWFVILEEQFYLTNDALQNRQIACSKPLKKAPGKDTTLGTISIHKSGFNG